MGRRFFAVVVLLLGCGEPPLFDADVDADAEVADGEPIELCSEGDETCYCHPDLPGVALLRRCDQGAFRVVESCAEGEACAMVSLDPPRTLCVELLEDESHPCE